jgi:hypothetical protein
VTESEFVVRDGGSAESFRNVVDAFEALAENLETLMALQEQRGAASTALARIDRTRTLALRGAMLARLHIECSSKASSSG